MSDGGSALPLSFGPIFRGYFIGMALYGMNVAQTYVYSISSERHARWEKCLAYFMLVFETTTTLWSSYTMYILGTHLSHDEAIPGTFGIDFALKFVAINTLTGTIASTIIQVFLGWRLVSSGRNLPGTLMIALTSMVSLAMGICTGVDMLQSVEPGGFGRALEIPQSVFVAPSVWLTARTVTDMLIISCSGPVVKQLRELIELEGIEAIFPLACLTATISVWEIILLYIDASMFGTAPDYLALEIMINKLHFIIFFTTLNSHSKKPSSTNGTSKGKHGNSVVVCDNGDISMVNMDKRRRDIKGKGKATEAEETDIENALEVHK